MPGYLVRHKDGTHIAKCLSDYTLASGFPYRWTIHKSRSHAFATRELADEMARQALEEDPECGAEIIKEEQR